MHYGPVSPPDEEALGHLLALAFGFDPVSAKGWFAAAGRHEVRSVRTEGELVAGLILIPMGQFFGGRRVSMIGVAGVGVRPDHRRRGVASYMMKEALHELARRGVSLSTLFAANQPLYRTVGYEAAGSRFRGQLGHLDIGIDDRELTLHLGTPGDRPRIHSLYNDVARMRSGFIDRGPYIWSRQHDTRLGTRAQTLLVANDEDELEGYVVYRQMHGEVRGRCEITDFVASTSRGYRHVWSALGDLGSIVDTYTFYTAPHDPAYLVHHDPRFTIEHQENWMMRIVNVRRALLERGWPRSTNLRLELEIEDDVLARNSGRIVLDLANGQPEVHDGGRGLIRIGIGGLAQLYSGFADPWIVAACGRVDAPAAELEALAAAFAGPLPWMQEMF